MTRTNLTLALSLLLGLGFTGCKNDTQAEQGVPAAATATDAAACCGEEKAGACCGDAAKSESCEGKPADSCCEGETKKP